ncbi:hypothetical protein PGSY75_0510100 [Plasmodium gaboni]|uniref:KHDC4/BBP-like KH-domain type I domain-containing protein n=1 Tax=Plasmodium gaboni TaxID=647221 RepID=A0A151LSY2_9APIC|nr:hypothetical protein PGSY75_0510100 [Plasmodium gaboni]KYO02298.1 hypothetical protein PGSY75_0510100 [Plasmodium gaboni]
MENNKLLSEPEGVNLYNAKMKNISNENTGNYMLSENNYFQDTKVQIKKNLLERSSKLCTVENRIRNISNEEKLMTQGNNPNIFVDSSIGFNNMYINNVQSTGVEKREVNNFDINENNVSSDNKEKSMNIVDNDNNKNCYTYRNSDMHKNDNSISNHIGNTSNMNDEYKMKVTNNYERSHSSSDDNNNNNNKGKFYNDHHLNINNQNYYNKNMNSFNNINPNYLGALNENKNFMYTQNMNISKEKNDVMLNGSNKKEVDFYINEEEQENMINEIMSYEHFTGDNNSNNNNFNNNNNYNNNNNNNNNVRNNSVHKNKNDCNNFICVENNNMGHVNEKISPSLDNKMYTYRDTIEYHKDMKKSGVNAHSVISKESDIIGSLKNKLEDQNLIDEEKNINNSLNSCITSDNPWNDNYEMKLGNNKLNDMNDSSSISNNLKENLKYPFNNFNNFNDISINDISKNVERDIFMNSHHNHLHNKNGSPDNNNNKNKSNDEDNTNGNSKNNNNNNVIDKYQNNEKCLNKLSLNHYSDHLNNFDDERMKKEGEEILLNDMNAVENKNMDNNNIEKESYESYNLKEGNLFKEYNLSALNCVDNHRNIYNKESNGPNVLNNNEEEHMDVRVILSKGNNNINSNNNNNINSNNNNNINSNNNNNINSNNNSTVNNISNCDEMKNYLVESSNIFKNISSNSNSKDEKYIQMLMKNFNIYSNDLLNFDYKINNDHEDNKNKYDNLNNIIFNSYYDNDLTLNVNDMDQNYNNNLCNNINADRKNMNDNVYYNMASFCHETTQEENDDKYKGTTNHFVNEIMIDNEIKDITHINNNYDIQKNEYNNKNCSYKITNIEENKIEKIKNTENYSKSVNNLTCIYNELIKNENLEDINHHVDEDDDKFKKDSSEKNNSVNNYNYMCCSKENQNGFKKEEHEDYNNMNNDYIDNIVSNNNKNKNEINNDCIINYSNSGTTNASCNNIVDGSNNENMRNNSNVVNMLIEENSLFKDNALSQKSLENDNKIKNYDSNEHLIDDNFNLFLNNEDVNCNKFFATNNKNMHNNEKKNSDENNYSNGKDIFNPLEYDKYNNKNEIYNLKQDDVNSTITSNDNMSMFFSTNSFSGNNDSFMKYIKGFLENNYINDQKNYLNLFHKGKKENMNNTTMDDISSMCDDNYVNSLMNDIFKSNKHENEKQNGKQNGKQNENDKKKLTNNEKNNMNVNMNNIQSSKNEISNKPNLKTDLNNNNSNNNKNFCDNKEEQFDTLHNLNHMNPKSNSSILNLDNLNVVLKKNDNPIDYYKVFNSFHDIKKNEHGLNTENNEFNNKSFIYDDINKSTMFNMPKIRNDNGTNIINGYNIKKEEVTNTSTLNSSNVLKLKHDNDHYINMTNVNKLPLLYENNNHLDNISDDDQNKRKTILNTFDDIYSVNDDSVENSLGLHGKKHMMTGNEDFLYVPNKIKEMVPHDNFDYNNEQLKKDDMYNYGMIKNNTINDLNFIDKMNSPNVTNKNMDIETTLNNNNNNNNNNNSNSNNYVYNISMNKQLFDALNNHNEKIHTYNHKNIHNNKEQEDTVSTFCKNNILNENKNETYMNNKQFNSKQEHNDNIKNSHHNNNFNSKNISNFLNETNVHNVFNSNDNILNYLKEQENQNEEREEQHILSQNRKSSQEKKISYNKFHNFDYVNNYDLSISSIMNNKANNNNDINSVNKMNDIIEKIDGHINNNYYQNKEGDHQTEKDKRKERNINELQNNGMNNNNNNNMINSIHLNKFDEKMIDLILNNGNNKCTQKGDDTKNRKFSNVINLNNIHSNDNNSLNNNINNSSTNYMLYDVLSEQNNNNIKNDIPKNENYNNGYYNKQNISPSNNSLNDRNNNYYKMDYRNKKNINANRNLTMNLPNMNNNNNMKNLPNGNFVNNDNVKSFFKTNNNDNNIHNNNINCNNNRNSNNLNDYPIIIDKNNMNVKKENTQNNSKKIMIDLHNSRNSDLNFNDKNYNLKNYYMPKETIYNDIEHALNDIKSKNEYNTINDNNNNNNNNMYRMNSPNIINYNNILETEKIKNNKHYHNQTHHIRNYNDMSISNNYDFKMKNHPGSNHINNMGSNNISMCSNNISVGSSNPSNLNHNNNMNTLNHMNNNHNNSINTINNMNNNKMNPLRSIDYNYAKSISTRCASDATIVDTYNMNNTHLKVKNNGNFSNFIDNPKIMDNINNNIKCVNKLNEDSTSTNNGLIEKFRGNEKMKYDMKIQNNNSNNFNHNNNHYNLIYDNMKSRDKMNFKYKNFNNHYMENKNYIPYDEKDKIDKNENNKYMDKMNNNVHMKNYNNNNSSNYNSNNNYYYGNNYNNNNNNNNYNNYNNNNNNNNSSSSSNGSVVGMKNNYPNNDVVSDNFLVIKKYTAKYEVQIDPFNGFDIAKRIIGLKGTNMKKICIDTDCKLRLRGRGSGYLEGEEKKEANESLHLCVSCQKYDHYVLAKKLIEQLLVKIYMDYDTWLFNHGKPYANLKPKTYEKFIPLFKFQQNSNQKQNVNQI